jgi:hypothetical protein
MNVTVPESVARAMFPCEYGTNFDAPEGSCGLPECHFSPCRSTPTVTWLVRESPLVCGGFDCVDGWVDSRHYCGHCNGTARPSTVSVVSEHLCFHEGQRLLRKEVCDCGTDDGLIHHGTVALGEPVPVVGSAGDAIGYPFIVLNLAGNAVLHHIPKAQAVRSRITDALGDQHIEPGLWAYEVRPT